jgi:hypothetical protein
MQRQMTFRRGALLLGALSIIALLGAPPVSSADLGARKRALE